MIKKFARLILSPKIYNRIRGVKNTLLHLFGLNRIKKSWYKIFHDNKDKLKNWRFLYVFCSSYALDIFFKCFRNFEVIKRLKIKARYTDGMVLSFPAMTSQYYGMFLDIMADQYISDYEKYFKEKLLLSAGDVVIDIGAHIGKFAVPVARRTEDVMVFAFEPDPYNHACLAKNVKDNKISFNNCILFNGVVAADRQDKLFTIGSYSTLGSIVGVKTVHYPENPTRISVKSVTLQDVFENNNINNCALLKLDCEGGEYDIFDSLPDMFFERIDRIVMELHIVEGRSIDVFKQMLLNRGFLIKGHLRNDGGWELFCKNHLIL